MNSRVKDGAPRGPADPRLSPRGARRGARSARPGWWAHPALGAGIVALLLFFPVVKYGFVRDDRELFADNPFLRNPGYFGKLVTSDFWSSAGANSGLWRPLVSASYWLDGRIGGWLPAWFHGVNLVSHVAVVALLALVMVEAGAGVAAAWLATLFFAVMPAHVEAVAWISGRTDVWCALFGLTSLWLHLRSFRARTSVWAWRAGAALAFALALMSKEAAAPLVVVLAVIAWRRAGDSEGGRLRGVLLELAPYLVLLAAWAIAHARIAPGALAATPQWRHPTLPERVYMALAVFPTQVLFLLPFFPHGPDWAIVPPIQSPADGRVAAGALLHLGALVLLVRTWRARAPIAPPLLLFWLPALLMSGLTLTRGVLLNGERHIYLSSAGAAWLAGMGGWHLWKRGLRPATFPRWILVPVLGTVLVAGIWQSLVQLGGWWSDETMYRAMIRAQPHRADGHLGLALVMIGQRNDRVALAAIQHAEEIDSTRYEAATFRAAIASRYGRWPEVIQWSRNSIRRGATEADPWLMEINALQTLNLLPWSRTLVETLMTHHHEDPDVAAAFGRQMLLENLPGRAVKPLVYAVGWNPQDPGLRLLLGDAWMRVNRPNDAIEEFRRAVGLEPSNVDAWLRLAAAYHLVNEVGLRDDAISNAASLPGADTTRIRRMYTRMLAGTPQSVLDSLKAR